MGARKVAEPEKRLKRTAGVKAVGKCGHEYNTRISLWPISGEPATPKALKQREKMIKEAADAFKDSVCHDCRAAEQFADAQADEQALLVGMGITALPELRGTLRQRAWAAQERLALMSGVVSEQMWNAVNLSLSDAVFDSALNVRFGSAPTEYGPEFDERLRELRSMLATATFGMFWGLRKPEPTARELLTMWLLSRGALQQLMALSETESRTWIIMSKRRRTFRGYGMSRHDIHRHFAARLITGTPGWQNPEQMFNAMTQLLSWQEETDAGMMEASVDLSLPEMLEQIAVMRALQPRRYDDAPF